MIIQQVLAFTVQSIAQLATILFHARAAKLVRILTLIICAKHVIATAPSAQALVLIVVHALLATM